MSAPRARAYVVVAAAAYLTLAVALEGTLGLSGDLISVGPMLLAAWLIGQRGALWLWLVVCPTHVLIALFARPMLEPVAWVHVAVGNVSLLGLGLGLGFLRDRYMSQIQLQREIEGRYERAARGANDVLWEWELQSGAVFYSETWAQLLGESRSELRPTVEEWFHRVHPEDLSSLQQEIARHREGETARFEHEHRLRRHDGEYVWVLSHGVMTGPQELGPQRITGWLTDITERRKSEAQLRELAFHDALTGLPNRSLFMDRLRHARERSLRKGTHHAVLLADLDRFKVVNDSLGHHYGDELLRHVADLLKQCVRVTDTIARFGGDEFVVLIEDIASPALAAETASELLGALCNPIELGGHRMVAGASLGVVVGGRDHPAEPEELVRQADIAMYRAKAMGGGRFVVFDPAAHEGDDDPLDLETELRAAVQNGQLLLHYQPIVEVTTGRVTAFEALVRWKHPTLGMVSPAKFIPVAEECGLIRDLGDWVLRRACEQARRLQQEFPQASPWRMGVNLSVVQLSGTDLPNRVSAVLEETGLAAEFLSLEITESGVLEDTEGAARAFATLRSKGVRLAMDDFGTGYSSLGYLRRFKVDTLKIDGSFVRDLGKPTGEEICRAVITLGRDLGLTVVAEGIEREQERETLRQMGCQLGQGYLFSRPLPDEELVELLRRSPGWNPQAA